MKKWSDLQGWFDFGPIYEYAVMRADPGAVFVEIGAWLGRSTAFLAQKIKESGKDIHLITIDHAIGSQTIPAEKEGHDAFVAQYGGNLAGALCRNLADCGLRDYVTLIIADRLKAAKLFQPASLDFVFLDGAHDYASVRADLETFWPLVKPGGLFAGHDYTMDWSGVVRAVDEFFNTVYTRHACTAIPCAGSWSRFKPY